MKQGAASSNISKSKQEPIYNTVSPCAAGQIGGPVSSKMAPERLYPNHGRQAPAGQRQTYPHGSQGKR